MLLTITGMDSHTLTLWSTPTAPQDAYIYPSLLHCWNDGETMRRQYGLASKDRTTAVTCHSPFGTMCRTQPRRHTVDLGTNDLGSMAGTARKANLPRKLSIEPRVPQRRLCKSGAKSIRPALEIDMSFGSRPIIIIIHQGVSA